MFSYISELKLRKKWKSLRDNYVRQKKKLNSEKCVSGALKKRKMHMYVHFNRMHQFLQNRTERNTFRNNVSTDNETNTILGTPNKSVNTNAMQIQVNPIIEYIANVFEKHLAVNKKEETDEDKLFCLSLVNEIKKVTETRRLKLKVEIYNLIIQNQIPISQPHQYQYQNDLNPSNFNFTASPSSLRRYFSTLYNQ